MSLDLFVNLSCVWPGFDLRTFPPGFSFQGTEADLLCWGARGGQGEGIGVESVPGGFPPVPPL